MIELVTVLDVECTGLRKPGVPPDDPMQPRLLQIAAKTMTQDGRTVSRFMRYIKPEGWSIEPEAEQVHGITERFAHQVGVPLPMALAELQASLAISRRIVGFNLAGYDGPVIELALRDCKAEGSWWRRRHNDMDDVMEMAQPILKLPGLYGDFKFPSLEEAMQGLVDSTWVSPHDAELDVDATAAVYWSIRNGA